MTSVFRVTGCPGGGKTTYLARQSQIAAERYGASNVAIASLTKTAASEIAGRDTPLPEQNIGTLHRHCYHALACTRDEMAETRPSMREFAAAHPELDTGDTDHNTELDEAPSEASSTHAAVMNRRARMTPADQWTDDERAYSQVWESFKQESGRKDFTDLVEACADDPILLPNVEALLLDEAQDFSALEMRLALAWSQHTATTVVVGDSDQCLYGWRGSDAHTLDALPCAGERLLQQSYRCSAAVRDLALTWIDQIEARKQITWQPTDETGTVSEEPFALCDTDDLLDHISGVNGSGQATTATTAILTTCGYMLDPTIAALRDAGIPFANVHRLKEQRWNPTRGKVFDAMRAYLRTSPQVHGEASGPRTWADLHAWTQLISAKDNLARGAKAAIEEHCRPDQFKQTRAGEIVPLAVLIDLLGSASHPALRNDIDWLTSALAAKHQRIGSYAARVYDRDPRGLLAEPKLTIGTVHSVKGATFDNVLLAPELSKEGFYGEHGWLGDGRDAIVRMAYVAITRARTSVHVLEPACPEYMPVADVLRDARRAA